MSRPSHSRSTLRRFERARDRHHRKQLAIALERRAAFQRGVLALQRLDWSRFGIGLKEAGDAMRRFLDAVHAALPPCNVDGCKRRHRPGCVLPGVGRVCPYHYLAGTGTKRPSGILDAALSPSVKLGLKAFAEQDRVQRQVDAILKSKPKVGGASGRLSSIQLHVQPQALPHPDPAQLHRAAHSHAVRHIQRDR